MISARLAWMAPVPGSMGGHVMTPISDERSSRMWWLPLGVYVPGGLGGLGKPAWWHGTLAASEPGEGRGADGRFNVVDYGPGLACRCHRRCRGPGTKSGTGASKRPNGRERADRGSYRR